MSEDGVSYRINASSGGPKEVIRLVGGKAVKSGEAVEIIRQALEIVDRPDSGG